MSMMGACLELPPEQTNDHCSVGLKATRLYAEHATIVRRLVMAKQKQMLTDALAVENWDAIMEVKDLDEKTFLLQNRLP